MGRGSKTKVGPPLSASALRDLLRGRAVVIDSAGRRRVQLRGTPFGDGSAQVLVEELLLLDSCRVEEGRAEEKRSCGETDTEGLRIAALSLQDCCLEPVGFASLAASLANFDTFLPALRELNLSGNKGLGPLVASPLVTALAARAHGPRPLVRLNLQGCELQDSGAIAVAEALQEMCGLRSLNLRSNGISAAACRQVVESTAETDLEELPFSGNGAEAETLTLLESHLVMNTLLRGEGVSADLRERALGDSAAKSVAAALQRPEAARLRSVDLRGWNLTADGISHLYEALSQNATLTELPLGATRTSADAAVATVARALEGRLATNALRRAGPSDAVRVAGDRGLGDEGVKEVASWLAEGAMPVALGLQHNAIGGSGALALATALQTVASLRELLLYSNKLGASGAVAITRALPPQLTALDIGSNCIGDAGARGVANALGTHPSLRELHLDYNDIGDDGGRALVHFVGNCRTVERLWLHGNSLSEVVLAALETPLEERSKPPPDETLAAIEAGVTDIDETTGEITAHATSAGGDVPAAIPAETVSAAVAAARAAASTAAEGAAATVAEQSDFGDEIACLSIREYLTRCGAHALGARGQLVLATICLEDEAAASAGAGELRVVALGVGTKFMPREVARADAKHRRCVRDSHAEVLARRALLRFFYRELALALRQEAEGLAGGRSASTSIFEAVKDTKGSPESRRNPPRFRLRKHLSLHLYVSTAPCGWASAGDSEAQDALNAPAAQPQCLTRHSGGHLAKGSGGGPSTPPGCVRLPGGLAEAQGICGVCLSCSDKIARWQRSGIQGRLLAPLLAPEPLRLASVTVGRKFDMQRCHRALHWRDAEPTRVLRAGVCLEVAVAAARGPGYAGVHLEKGDGDECATWSLGDALASRHDGRTGLRLPADGGGVSPVAGARLLDLCNAIRAKLGQPPFATYVEAKAQPTQSSSSRAAGALPPLAPLAPTPAPEPAAEPVSPTGASLAYLRQLGLPLVTSAFPSCASGAGVAHLCAAERDGAETKKYMLS
eukprot:TRINITY_DN12700_c0_g1_i2.p1 TRINITY_DN12700_c0_g1~~TRINITY_DN12700_c0_g1_i2.p1  ORF type:complete len:1022 (-),score=183.04 TRINITY_DN12700_c0_g1_i2:479-3544(-)